MTATTTLPGIPEYIFILPFRADELRSHPKEEPATLLSRLPSTATLECNDSGLPSLPKRETSEVLEDIINEAAKLVADEQLLENDDYSACYQTNRFQEPSRSERTSPIQTDDFVEETEPNVLIRELEMSTEKLDWLSSNRSAGDRRTSLPPRKPRRFTALSAPRKPKRSTSVSDKLEGPASRSLPWRQGTKSA